MFEIFLNNPNQFGEVIKNVDDKCNLVKLLRLKVNLSKFWDKIVILSILAPRHELGYVPQPSSSPPDRRSPPVAAGSRFSSSCSPYKSSGSLVLVSLGRSIATSRSQANPLVSFLYSRSRQNPNEDLKIFL